MADLIEALRTVADYASTVPRSTTVRMWCVDHTAIQQQQRERHIAIGRSLSNYLGPDAQNWDADQFAEFGEAAEREANREWLLDAEIVEEGHRDES